MEAKVPKIMLQAIINKKKRPISQYEIGLFYFIKY